MSIDVFLSDLKKKYPDSVSMNKSLFVVPSDLPEPLKGIYALANGLDLPFGYVLPIERAVEESKNSPFSPDWFVFGKDHYFSFWLCAYKPDEDGAWITTWDHESRNEIDGAVWKTLEEFFAEMLDEHEAQEF